MPTPRLTTFPQELAKWIVNVWMGLVKRGKDHGHPIHYALIVELYRCGIIERPEAMTAFRKEFEGICAAQ